MTDQLKTAARKHATLATLAILGGAIAAAIWAGGDHGWAVGVASFYAVCCVALFVWSRGDGDVAAIVRLSGDERQTMLDLRATAATGVVTILFSLGGAIINLARGGSGGPWTLICTVAGFAYITALAWSRRHH